MFFFLSKTLSFLLHPLTWILLPLALSVVPKLSRWKKGLRIAGIVAAFVFTNPFLANLALRAWEPPPTQITEPTDVAIVLGGMANARIQVEGQIQFNDNVERILSAIKLYREGMVRRLIISGGSGDLRSTGLSESPLLKELAISLDVPPEAIVIETESQNTHQNAVYVKQLLAQDTIESPIILITSASHMRRALGCFSKEEVDVLPYPVDYGEEPIDWHFMNFLPDGDELHTWNELIREWIGYMVYDVVGYI